jgi:hypothetical protein
VLRGSADTERVGVTKQFRVPYNGTVRVTFDVKSSDGSQIDWTVSSLPNSYGSVSPGPNVYQTVTTDVEVQQGGAVSVSAWVFDSDRSDDVVPPQPSLKNVRISYDIVAIDLQTEVLVD